MDSEMVYLWRRHKIPWMNFLQLLYWTQMLVFAVFFCLSELLICFRLHSNASSEYSQICSWLSDPLSNNRRSSISVRAWKFSQIKRTSSSSRGLNLCVGITLIKTWRWSDFKLVSFCDHLVLSVKHNPVRNRGLLCLCDYNRRRDPNKFEQASDDNCTAIIIN